LDSASQRNVAAEQKKLLTALYRHICMHYEPADASDRYAAILLRIPTIRKVAAKKNESLQIIDMFNLFSLNSLVKETALGIRSPHATIPPVVSPMNDDIKPIVIAEREGNLGNDLSDKRFVKTGEAESGGGVGEVSFCRYLYLIHKKICCFV
uniref:NR LBD domain-containing protein n=1 Tax=Toxocara canis TaxID=6265 RepID=A0A183VAU1_TOXCA